RLLLGVLDAWAVVVDREQHRRALTRHRHTHCAAPVTAGGLDDRGQDALREILGDAHTHPLLCLVERELHSARARFLATGGDDRLGNLLRIRDTLRLRAVLGRRDESLDDARNLLGVLYDDAKAVAVLRRRALAPQRDLSLGHQLRER